MHEPIQQAYRQNDTISNETKTALSEQAARYRAWLATQTKQQSNDTVRERNDYAQRATRIVQIGERRIQSFAPFRYKYSALQTITAKQSIIVTLIGLALLLGMIWNWQQTLLLVVSIIALGYLVHLVLDFGLALAAVRRPSEEHIDDEIIAALDDAEWPPYTILCPLYREAQVVPQFVAAMKALNYPTDKLQILFLTEADDAETRRAILALNLPDHFSVVTVPDGSPRTKPRACNYGLIEATGQYVVIYDAEDVPDPLQLKKAVLTFANHGPDLACVQAKLNFYNPGQNLLTRWFTAEYSLWFDLILPGLQQARLAIPLGGTSNHFPTQTLQALGAWDAFNVTEDCDLGLRLAWFRLKTVVLDSTTYEEANSRFKNWIRQRSRWIKGYMQTYLVHMREPLHYLRQKRIREFISLQLVIGGKAAVLLINPLMWLLLAVYLILHHVLGTSYGVSLPRPILYISAFCLVLGNFFYGYIYLLGCMRRQQYSLVKWMLLIPLYWIMSSIAACMALYQLITKPHYWEKTIHGLHLKSMAALPSMGPQEMARFTGNLPYVPMPEALQEGTIPFSTVQRYERLEAVPVASVQAMIEEMVTQRKPAFSAAERQALRLAQQTERKDPWLIMAFAGACIASIAACRYFIQQQQILLFNVALAHLRLARQVIDGTTPFNITRLGGTWLPLPQMLMLPFIWNDTLWRSGLAGSIPSMISFVIAALYIFRLARLLTNDDPASFIAALIFILNPNMLYLQSTALDESIVITTLTAACYYFVAWVQAERLKDLLFTGICTCLATLAGYEGWSLLIVLTILLIATGLLKHQPKEQLESNVLVFVLMGGLGILLWLLWEGGIFGDSFYFLHHPYIESMQRLPLIKAARFSTYHDLWQALRFYTLDVLDVVGPALVILTGLAIIVFLARQRLRPTAIATLGLLTPFCFYAATLYMGTSALLVPGVIAPDAPQQLFNTYYGAEMIPAAAIFTATLISGWRWQASAFTRYLGRIVYLVCFAIVVIQMIVIAYQGCIVIRDGLNGLSRAPQHMSSDFPSS